MAESGMNSAVVVCSRLPDGGYSRSCVRLAQNYGTAAYYQQDEIRAIDKAVDDCLREIESRSPFIHRLRARQVIIKPNLVTVFHQLGTLGAEYPQTTDPRLLDALVRWLKQYTGKIAVVEASGRGIPTRASFSMTGLDRLAHRHGIDLVALEEQPINMYHLPKARVMRTAALPRYFHPVVTGDAFYISVPKLKTNLFTGVTLGFKNNMGLLPYNLRQRNHNYALDQKLVDLLFLIRPDLTVIDGIIGGEGNCPAPVEPRSSHTIIVGNHPVETDRTAATFMGFDPGTIPLIQLADDMGFSAENTQIVGDFTPVPFKPADPSLLSAAFRERYPNVQVLVGSTKGGISSPGTLGDIDLDLIHKMEMACRGGCLAATRYGFDMLAYEGFATDLELTVVIGDGLTIQGERWYFDHSGKPFNRAAIQGMKHVLAVGTCTVPLQTRSLRYVPGCMPFPNAAHSALHKMIGKPCRIIGMKNRHLLRMLWETITSFSKRSRLIHRGIQVDLPLQMNDQIEMSSTIYKSDPSSDWVLIPSQPLTADEIGQAIRTELQALMAVFP